MKIFGDVLSPFVRMTIVTAHETGLMGKVAHAFLRVSPSEENTELSAHSPLARVPVLVTDHGHAIYDSRVIIEYLCHVAGDKALIPDDGVKRFRILTLLAIGQGLADTAVAYRYETAARPQGTQWPEWIARQRERMAAVCDELEKAWLGDLGHLSAGTISVACALGYIDFRLPDIKWRDGRPGLAAWHGGFSARPSMAATKLG
jgi:glutathione S-transferase